MKVVNVNAAFIICARVGEGPGPGGAPLCDGEIRRCARCDHEVTITPASAAAADARGAEPLCIQCSAAVAIARGEPIKTDPWTEDQKYESLAFSMKGKQRQ